MRRQNDPWQLVKAGHYADAIKEYDLLIGSQPEPKLPWLVNQALAMVALGRYSDAKKVFLETDDLARKGGSRMLMKAAQAALLANSTDQALELSLLDVEQLQSHKTTFTDFFAGASSGLFLYYLGVSLASREARSKALKFLDQTIAEMQTMNPWPGPVARFMVGAASFQDVLNTASGATTIDKAVAVSKTDIAAARMLVTGLFYAATKHRDDGNEKECAELMSQCCNLPNHHLELEWYLARREVLLALE
jgi:tetratricopeptide (TPR) repeat protein